MSCAYKFNVESERFGVGIVSEHWGLVVESDCVIDASDIKNGVSLLVGVGTDASAHGFRDGLYGSLSRPQIWGTTIAGFIANTGSDVCQFWFDPLAPIAGISSPSLKYPGHSDQWLTYNIVANGYSHTDAPLADYFAANAGGTIDVRFRINV